MGPEPIKAEASTPDPAKSFKRACDCCRKRKVRCDAQYPCGPCKKAAIKCAYLQPPRKKGPKGLRSARVLHALRKIDEASSPGPTSPPSPNAAHGDSSYWSWNSSGSSPSADAASLPSEQANLLGVMPGMSSQTFAMQQQHIYHPPQPGPQHVYHAIQHAPPIVSPVDLGFQHAWHTRAVSPASRGQQRRQSRPQTQLPPQPALPNKLPNDFFLPYVRLFFDHLFPIMPVIDKRVYLNLGLYDYSSCLTSETYAFLSALSAATMVQLDGAAQPPPFHIPPGIPHANTAAELFVEECLRERQAFDYIEHPTTMTVMTSFFVFAYYGNNEKHEKAWHYLQESISFAQVLGLDDENAILKLDPVEAQWRRRLYWLLFVTERAYAIQRRKQTRLHASIQLPLILESEDPQLLNGFVNLVHLFSAIDENFVQVWRGTRRGSLCSAPWLADTQRALDGVALAIEDIKETQHLDISVSREWLHVLAWQMGVGNGLFWGKGEGGMRLEYPVELARRVVGITEGANPLALDSHGIGMEQKLSDIAGCLADVLKCAAGDTSDTFACGRQYLHLLLSQLSRMRGKESRYLRPLMSKMDDLMGYEIAPELPLPIVVAGMTRAGIAGLPRGLLGAPRGGVVELPAGGGKVLDEEQMAHLWRQ